ncbi:GNAT family N-acetyltransferase [Arthrobacter sp. B0490]|uniref:GNAT family N-acetyltransferase n=1 Tax=Arthrobacter sp. B0490 TaxID=2058891 RepID=UPI000CE437BD|nr:GNAT family N-acetyltransferase [Arthrobacter sp. B0490]
MTLTIRRANFDAPGLTIFLEAHLADMAPLSPLESRHGLDLAALQKPTVRLWVALEEQRIAGTCALAALTPEHEELKSMRTDPELRGKGIASKLLDHVVTDARTRGITQISLETGSMDFFAPARTLYAKNGFDYCEPFGSYTDDPYSSYMTRVLQ